MTTHKLNPLIIALDVATGREAFGLVGQINAPDLFVKVGMQLFYSEGPALVHKLREQGIKIFVDLKLHDIPNTVKGAAEALAGMGISMLTVHCAGGRAMLEAVREGVEKGASLDERPLIVGVTQLTSTTEQVMNEEIGIPGSIEKAVLHYACLAQSSGLDGVVCAAKEVPLIKRTCGSSFITVTPGIRPAGSKRHDQARLASPQDALRLGSDFLVVGRAITQAKDPVAAYQAVIKEMNEVV
ncbi:orotidine 5'-phosphate decarboxylase [Caldalkalibacillus thermarum TA2.A1]|uniref:Orotidine 5'-phosphate decarboxylase n=1 Tax=Caldalkalibacillus thermarum (strain TA2.A1) TaxID=986075 RepID=F5L6E3_CALTT|nr:orotidine-5'-phosphate decarboxylase [Caldalkalibacillus thermarum]EGL83096.1 orotidine 5'-phosphate decarboxylase [Caldalkalibacillus thermarum TA2.A1]QZT32782.1 orotidine-5'-phosphate decarboxylase [Caldalkalibacillus thermarum TA2.A1]